MKKIILTISLITTFVLAYSEGYDGYTGCAEQDSLALVAFYWATDGPNWTSNQDGFSISNLGDDVLFYYTDLYPYAGMGKWLEGPVKDWFGVLLEKQQIGNTTDSIWRVIHLRATINRRSAGDNNLNGYVPKEVGLLTALQWFKVNGNVGLTGPLPDEIYHPTLRQIDAEATYFSGIVSDAIRQCTVLEFINLRYNYFDSVPVFDFIDENHFDTIFTDPGAVKLFLYQNQISWATIEPTVDYMLPLGGVYEARDQKDVGRAKEIVVTPGSDVTLTSNDAGSQGTYTWYKNGLNTYLTGSEYTISSVSASDTGNYTILVANDYIRLNDANGDYANTFTKPIHLTFIPSTPVCNKLETTYNGQEIYLTFSKPMPVPSASQSSEFTVTANGSAIDVVDIERKGRLSDIFVLKLATPIIKNDTVLVSYSAGTVVDQNGGVLSSFSDKSVTNLVRETPTLVDAITRASGEGIILTFDTYIDDQTLSPEGFEIQGSEGNSIVDVLLLDGELDNHISKKIELVLNEPLYDTDTLYVSYTMGKISALYGATVQSFTSFPVTNVVTAVRTDVNLFVIDGTGEFDQIVIKGEMKSLPFELYDDGTNGDEVADDNIWTKALSLADGTYEWEVYSRTINTEYDTTITIDGNGQITIVITPITENIDSLISADFPLELEVESGVVTGDTIFEYHNNTLTFILNMKNYMNNNPGVTIEPYLMGINDDWTKGIALSVLDSSETELTYSTTKSGFGTGELIYFNFRNGSEWENNTPEMRTHTVAGNDVITSIFGQIKNVGINYSSQGNVLIFPNPVSENLNLHVLGNRIISSIKLFNIHGMCVYYEEYPISSIHTGFLSKGIYVIEVTVDDGTHVRSRFIKL